jgi:hypothetical protein
VSTPAVDIRSFVVTIPAGTAETAPYTEDVTFPPRVVLAVRWRVPPGPSGLMGWRLTMSGGQVVLPSNGGYIIADNATDLWPLTGQPDSGAWEVTGYNTDIYDHAVYLDFQLELIGQADATPALIPNSQLTSPAPVTITTVTTPPPVTIPAVTTPPPVTIPAVTVPGT